MDVAAHSMAFSVRASHSSFRRSLLSADLHHVDGPQGETNFARGRGTSPNCGSFTPRVMVSCSAHRGRGGAFNGLVGTSDSLFFFCRSLLSSLIAHLLLHVLLQCNFTRVHTSTREYLVCTHTYVNKRGTTQSNGILRPVFFHQFVF